MRAVKFGLLLALVLTISWSSPSARAVAVTGQGPTLTSIGPLAFGADGTLFVADNQSAAIYAFDLAGVAANGAPGAKGTDGLDQKLAAMLGTGAIVKRPRVIVDASGNESIGVRSICYLPLTYDHRLIDGADAGRFLTTIRKRLEEGAFEADLGL